jgi:hypothetical protein
MKGAVLRYIPLINHCREGIAFVGDDGAARDTYWREHGDGESHRLTESELEGAVQLFNVDDYDRLDPDSAASREQWERFRPSDRGRITMQHGLHECLFLRKGASPDLDTQIENAERRIKAAAKEQRAAELALEARRGEHVALVAKREALA